MLSIRGLEVRYDGTTAVRGVDLEVEAGEIVTLVGPTGCGKSSVLRAVAGLEPVAAGAIRLGELVADARRHPPPERRGVGLLFQDFALFPHLNVARNVGFRVRRREEADRWIRSLGLEPFRDAMPGTLSGGQRQRVALARCMAHEPRLVLLDEPLSNLDASLKATLRWQVREALEAAGVTAVWVTHDQDEALSVGDRVAIMEAGRLVQVDRPETCFREPADRFVARFLGEGSFLEGRVEAGRVETVLGSAAARLRAAGGGAEAKAVEALLRPRDLRLEAEPAGNGRVLWSRFEGETRLYGVRLDSGPELRVRRADRPRLEPGARVRVAIEAAHPLPVFPTEPG